MSRSVHHRKTKSYPDPFHSYYEYKVHLSLKELGVKHKYEPDKFEYFLNTRKGVCRDCGSNRIQESHIYTPDWYIPSTNIYIESKGLWTGRDRRIISAMKIDHPDIEIKMLFQSDKWLSKKKANRYSDWCKSHGIDWHVSYAGVVPEAWY